MSKHRKYGRIAPDDVLRYLGDEMSDRERNALEKEAQRDPFVEDALEGLSVQGSGEARRDLEKLGARLERRIGMRRSITWIPVAASVAVLLALGTVYFTVFSNRLGKMDRMIAGSESVEPAKEQRAGEEIPVPVTREETGEALTEESPAETPGETDAVGMQRETPDGKAEPSGYRESPADGETGLGEPIAPPRKISGDLAQPVATGEEETVEIPGPEDALEVNDRVGRKMAQAERTFDGEAAGESPAVRSMPEQPVTESKVLEETVVLEMIFEDTTPEQTLPGETSGEVRYIQAEGRAKSAAPAIQTIPDTIPAVPAGGMEPFRRYIEDNLRFPEGDNLPVEGIVELSFSLDPQGHPRNIEVESSPDDAFSREAIRLLREGPAWSPEFIDGMPSGRKIQISVEFRKR